MPQFPDLFILRHGQTEWNVAGRYQGQRDSPLTALGVAQAKTQGEILRGVLEGRILPAYASPLGRAARTAELALAPLGQQARLDSRLKELNFGSREGKTRAEVAQTGISSRFAHYFSDPEGESFQDIESRCRAFLDDLESESIVITHGITSRILRGIWLGLSGEDMLDLPVDQGCIYHLRLGAVHCLTAPTPDAA